MIQEATLIRPRQVIRAGDTPRIERPVRGREMLRVLERAAADDAFIAQLTDHPEDTLAGYALTWQEKAALLSGDVRWIEASTGPLSPRLRTWLECRLQQEKW